MKQQHAVPRKQLLATALLLAMTSPVMAQDANADQDKPASAATEEAKDLDTIVVVGIRGALQSAMNLKRDSQGVVDGIAAEDIGKFPDTNLAESLQRISGVSIDRTASGEGSKVTVRGIGPDYNLVLLNGRQMPAAGNANGAGVSNSRAFDFANLASESISEVEVYKTSRAANPAGGIGATLNIKTARPLEAGNLANIGVKAVHDTSNGNLPGYMQGNDFTGEVSGIFSRTFADGKFGIALTGSYQDRDSGYSQVSVPGGWRAFRGDENNWGTIPQPGTPGSENVTNRPGPTDVYSVPQNLNYNVNGIQRQRTNGQLTLQWAPTDRLTATLDYTYSENKIQQQRNELSVWFNYGPSVSSWTDGPIAGPIIYSELIPGANSDLSMGGAQLANASENKSLGFNVEWEVTDNFDVSLDYHDSSAETKPDSPYGSAGVLGMAAFVRGTTTVDFSGDFPILNVQLPAGQTAVQPSQALVTGSVFQNAYAKSDVEQLQLKGRFEFGEYSGLDFGVSATEVNNRTAYAFMQRDTWGGVGTPADYADDIFTADDMAKYFGSFGGAGSADFTGQFLLFDFARLAARAAELTGHPEWYRAPTAFEQDLRTIEKSKSAFVQWATTVESAVPIHVAAGLRYEKTDVTSSAQVPVATGIQWQSDNELNLVFGQSTFATRTGSYGYVLPSLDVKVDLSDSFVMRGSWGKTIGRPGWNDIKGGQTLDRIVRIDGGIGSTGDPNLKPLVSENFDLSLEWYYGDASYVSAGWFSKDIDNYIGATQVLDVGGSDGETPFNLHTPVGGAYWNAAVANGCISGDTVCIRDYIFANFNGQPGVTQTGTANGHATGIILGLPTDPLANFRISTVANQRSASLSGFEFNLQHVFGDSGFGLSANYTIVDSPDLYFNNANTAAQSALVGLSDSANLVGFYDKGAWQIRAAYNWRDEFLSANYDSERSNPQYVEAFGQLDLSIGYKISEKLTIQFEGINVTDETARVHGRNQNNLLYLTQTGPRYMLGARYKF
jgi:TonB-dependent receptor